MDIEGLGVILRSGEFVPYEQIEDMRAVERIKGQTIEVGVIVVRRHRIDYI